jgi:type II secretion system protein I
MSTQTNNTAHIRDRTLAEWVASNELNKQRLNFKLTQRALNGRATGTQELGGIEWHWVALGQVTAVEEIRRIEIAVGKDAEAAASNPVTTLAGFIYDQ